MTINPNELDRHITGNWGEDSVPPDEIDAHRIVPAVPTDVLVAIKANPGELMCAEFWATVPQLERLLLLASNRAHWIVTHHKLEKERQLAREDLVLIGDVRTALRDCEAEVQNQCQGTAKREPASNACPECGIGRGYHSSMCSVLTEAQ